jgi:hypothetical protein
MDLDFIRDSYQKMSDDELIRIATTDASGLTPQAQEIIKEEVAKRKLDTNILKGVEAQNKSYSIEEIDKYCNLVQTLSCPICKTNSEKLNATMTSEVVSAIVFSTKNKKIKVGCPSCLDKANNSALTKSVLLGWWGIPWGIFWTIKAINDNLKSKRTNHIDTPNDYLRGFTVSKIGQLETYKDDKTKLQQIIATD